MVDYGHTTFKLLTTALKWVLTQYYVFLQKLKGLLYLLELLQILGDQFALDMILADNVFEMAQS